MHYNHLKSARLKVPILYPNRNNILKMWPIYGNIWLKWLYYLVWRSKETCLILVTLAATELTRTVKFMCKTRVSNLSHSLRGKGILLSKWKRYWPNEKCFGDPFPAWFLFLVFPHMSPLTIVLTECTVSWDSAVSNFFVRFGYNSLYVAWSLSCSYSPRLLSNREQILFCHVS